MPSPTNNFGALICVLERHSKTALLRIKHWILGTNGCSHLRQRGNSAASRKNTNQTNDQRSARNCGNEYLLDYITFTDIFHNKLSWLANFLFGLPTTTSNHYMCTAAHIFCQDVSLCANFSNAHTIVFGKSSLIAITDSFIKRFAIQIDGCSNSRINKLKKTLQL